MIILCWKVHEDQRDERWQGLHVENLLTRGDRAVDASDDHACEHEDRGVESFAALQDAHDEPGREKAIVEPLIRGEHFRCGRGLLRLSEGAQSRGLVPQEHLEDKNVDVNQRDNADGDDGREGHSDLVKGRNKYCGQMYSETNRLIAVFNGHV